MQQTLLALCAVAVFSIYALNTTRGEAAAELRSVTAGAEDAVAAAARARLGAADRLAFDEQDVGRGNQTVRMVVPTSGLRPDAGESATDPTTFDDVDDFNGFVEERDVQAGGRRESESGVLRFRMVYTVQYVDPADPARASAVPTLAKELVVSAREITTGETGRPPVLVTFRKVFTPAGMTSFRART